MRQIAREMAIIELRRRKNAESDIIRERRRQERQRMRNDNAGVQGGEESERASSEEVEWTWSGTEDK